MNHTTHCQICAREIKANTGVIAHHGYTRPGWGWQTESCEGAKYLPYEVSRDRIPYAIANAERAAAFQEDIADNMLRNPDETLTRVSRNPYNKEETKTEFARPEGFNPYEAVNSGSRAYSFHSYENEFVKQYELHRSYELQAKQAARFLQKRYDEWKPAPVEAA